MKKDKLKPMLFSVMKHYDAKKLITDIISGIIVAVIALPLIYSYSCRFHHFISWRKPSSDSRTYSSLCYHSSRNSC